MEKKLTLIECLAVARYKCRGVRHCNDCPFRAPCNDYDTTPETIYSYLQELSNELN